MIAEQIWQILREVKDPEIPTLSVIDLGLIRSVGVLDDKITITMVPTFAGCPALEVMRGNIAERLQEAGAQGVEVKFTLHPPWSSDWITAEGRRKLKSFGLAPPPVHGGQVEAILDVPAVCPYCDSADTERKNDFGPTLCRAIYVCRACRQPFEGFKPI